MTRTAKATCPGSLGGGMASPPPWSLVPSPLPVPAPLSMVCCCLAEQMRRLMPSMTWLLESTSFSRGFLLRKMVGTEKQAGMPSVPAPGKAAIPLPPQPAAPSSCGRGR